jgi:putative nucleotidyltransferase with HDIG domain
MTYKVLPEKGRFFVGAVVALGSLVIAHSVSGLWDGPFGSRWLILAALTLLSGSATVKLPSVPATISISETFVFTSVLLYGPAAGATIVALDGLIISSWFARRRKELYRVLFNMAAPALSIWLSAQVYFLFPDIRPLVSSEISIEQLIVPLLTFTILHFLINSALIAVAVACETGRGVWNIWRGDFLWLSLNYFGGASVSALLVVYTREIDPAYLSIIVPLLLILYFTFKIPMARVEDTNRHLTKVNTLYLSTIETLALAIDAKDQVTHGHIRRVQTFAVELARAIGISDTDQLKAIEASALLHDMGKLAVPEHILNKPGRLTPAEFEKMKLHASIGADILSSIEFPYPVVPIVRHHHENWNGTGYPAGISGIDIPIGARILSVVDCFDALTSDRPYRPRLSLAAATQILMERRSTMYDPLVVDAFVKLQPALFQEPELPHDVGVALPIPLSANAPHQSHSDVRRADSRPLQVFKIYQLLAEGSSMPWDDVVDLFLNRLNEIVPFEASLVYVYDRESDELVCESARGRGLQDLLGRRVAIGVGLTGWVAAHRKSQLNSPGALDASGDAGAKLAVYGNALVVPICQGDTLLGVVSLYCSGPEGFSKVHEDLLVGLGQHLAPLIKTKRSVGAQLTNHSSAFLSGGDLDKYLRQIQSLRIPPAFVLVVLRLASGRAVHGAVDEARQLYSVLREGDLVFVCDAQTVVCWLADADRESARIVENRLTAVLGAKLESVRQYPSGGGLPSSLAALLSRGDQLQPVSSIRH